jgi:nitroimidazol reductase NimA-like FMN-containing flavoprotein (pyridoxamine 5'-phosphate oxidase superfamily)
MINKKNIIFASTQVQKITKFERKQQTICILVDEKHVNYWSVDRSNKFPCYK